MCLKESISVNARKCIVAYQFAPDTTVEWGFRRFHFLNSEAYGRNGHLF
ncbi:hypothetical protein NIES2104_05520 [Leptolyngbya sp. NIES-2104]|nr:hypothetical protein NIES2104_05520 [Leptolyngbya sp. NIES-2104]